MAVVGASSSSVCKPSRLSIKGSKFAIRKPRGTTSQASAARCGGAIDVARSRRLLGLQTFSHLFGSRLLAQVPGHPDAGALDPQRGSMTSWRLHERPLAHSLGVCPRSALARMTWSRRCKCEQRDAKHEHPNHRHQRGCHGEVVKRDPAPDEGQKGRRRRKRRPEVHPVPGALLE